MKSHGKPTSLADALALVRARVLQPLPAEEAPLAQAAGRILATALIAPRDLPAQDISMMDGYALRAADVGGPLRVVYDVAAGAAPAALPLGEGEAARIFTGAPVPLGADCVVMQEHAVRTGAQVQVEAAARALKVGQHIRRRGEEVRAGATVLAAGSLLGPASLALAGANGRATLPVFRRPRLALLSTGDELVPLGTEPRPGQIIETNSIQLSQLARECGADPVFLGIARDDVDSIALLLRDADVDVIVTTGGASVGDHDHAQAALQKLGGALVFHTVAIRPGKPILFGTAAPARAGGPVRLVFGLPGNPAANMLGFELFVRTAVRALSGDAQPERRPVRAVLRGAPLARVADLTFFPRGRASVEGTQLVFSAGGQQSSMQIGSFAGVNAMAQIAPGQGVLQPGDELDVVLLGLL